MHKQYEYVHEHNYILLNIVAQNCSLAGKGPDGLSLRVPRLQGPVHFLPSHFSGELMKLVIFREKPCLPLGIKQACLLLGLYAVDFPAQCPGLWCKSTLRGAGTWALPLIALGRGCAVHWSKPVAAQADCWGLCDTGLHLWPKELVSPVSRLKEEQPNILVCKWGKIKSSLTALHTQTFTVVIQEHK